MVLILELKQFGFSVVVFISMFKTIDCFIHFSIFFVEKREIKCKLGGGDFLLLIRCFLQRE